MTQASTPSCVDVHALPAMLTALRLPSFQRHWQRFAEQADAEGWPAARLLATLAEIELAEREERRIRRYLGQSGLPGGKTLATFEFKAIPSLPRARIEALAAGDWLETGANLIAIGNSGAGKTHILCAIGHALVEAGNRVLYSRTTDLVQRLQAARRDLTLESALAKLDKFDLIILDDITYAQKDRAGKLRPLRTHRTTIRKSKPRDRRQPALQCMGQGLPRQGRDRRRGRQAGTPCEHP